MLRIIIGLLFGILCGTMLAGCDEKSQPVTVIKPPITAEVKNGECDFSLASTKGNFAYLPINKNGEASSNVGDVLTVLSEFEKTHPEIEIMSFQIETYCASQYYPPHTSGIWIHHRRPKNR